MGPAMRVLVLLMAGWLWMLPQALNSSGVRTVCDEYGIPVPVPTSEEEELKHTKLAHCFQYGAEALLPKPPKARAPHSEHAPLAAALQEVPYPPPRV